MAAVAKRILNTCVSLFAVLPLAAQPSLPPTSVPKPERVERGDSDARRVEETRRAVEAAKSANAAKKSSSSSKNRATAEIRGFTFSDSARGNRPIIIKSAGERKVREQLKEDLLVMCRIIEKAAQDHISDMNKAAGIDLLALGGNRSVRTMYLEDYGVIFTLNVRIPLLNDAKTDETDVKEAAHNEEWQETRNELFGQKRRIKRVETGHGPGFDEADVQDLKNELLDGLKNASNIRNLKPADWIVVAATGPGMLETEVIQVERGRGDGVEKLVVPRVEVFGFEEGQGGGESTMMLRIRKNQLDEITKRDGSPEELRKALEASANVQIY